MLLVASAVPASAHAQLESTSPAPSSVLLVPPTQVVLHFGEPVEVDFGSLRVLGPNGQRVDSGGAHHPGGDGHAVATSLLADFPKGTYVVAWRVISADSHPVHGAFVFSVGSASGASKADAEATTLADQSGSAVVGAIYWLIRFAAFVGLLFLVGLALMVTLTWRQGGSTRRVGRLLWASWWLLLTATVLGIVIQGVYAAALPIGDIVRPSLITSVLHARFGIVEVLRLLLLIAFVPVLLAVQDRLGNGSRRWKWIVPVELVLGAALLFTPGLAGHASSGDQPGIGLALDVVHLAAASLWLGGLLLLASFLVARAPDDQKPEDPARVTLKVSTVAFIAVVVIVGTGVCQSIRQVGSIYALFHTTYGWTLVVKILFVILLIGLGALSRRIVHGGWGLRHPVRPPVTPEHSGQLSKLRRSVLAEIAIALVVLAVTALLVNAVPAKQAAALPFSTSFSTLGVQVNTIIDPARAGGGNTVHVYVLSGTGTPKAIPELDMTLSLPAENLGPLAIPLVVAGPGHYNANNFVIPVTGNWILRFTVRTDAIDEQVVSVPLPIH